MNPVAEGALIAIMVAGGLVALLVLLFWDERKHEPRVRLTRKSSRASDDRLTAPAVVTE